MADKKKPSFRQLYSRWSSQEDRAAARTGSDENRLAAAQSILSAIQQDGAELSDDQYNEALAQILNTGNLDTSKLSGYSKTSAPVIPTSREEMPQMSATTSQSIFDQLTTDPRALISDIGTGFQAGAREGLAGILSSVSTVANAGVRNPAVLAATKLAGIELPVAQNPEFITREAARLRSDAANLRASQLSDRALLGREVVGDTAGFRDTAGAYLANPTILADELSTQAGQLYSALPGAGAGSTGLIVAQGLSAAGNQGQQAYDDVIAKGGSKAAAEKARNVAGSISLAANTAIPLGVPGGNALERLIAGGANAAARRSVIGAAAVPLAGEATSEALTEVLDQGGLNFATGEPLSKGLGKAAAAGAVLGGVMGGAPAAVDARNTSIEINERAANTEADILSGANQAAQRSVVLPQDTGLTQEQIVQNIDNNPNVDRELFNAEQDIAQDTSRASSLDEAFSQREQEEALQRQVEEEAGFRTIANQTNSSGSLADSLRQAGIQTEVTPDQVANEMLQSQSEQNRQADLEAQRAAQVRAQEQQVKTINDVARTRESLRKQQEKAQAAQDKKTKAATTSQRTAAIKQLLTDNPNATDADIANLLPSKIEEVVKAKPATTARKAATRTTATPVAPTTQTADVAKLKASKDPLDRIQGLVSERLGMAGQVSPQASNFNDKVRTISRRLAGDTSQRAASVEKLINQGKIVIVPNAEAAGRETTSRKGEYDTGEGTTYIYTDNLTDGTHAELMEAAAHESGHLGQFNERDQRPEIMRALLGRGVTKASDILRKSAANGNTFARDALSRAQADTEARRSSGEENPERYENEELVAYAIGQENAGRTGTLGSASGAIRDIVSGAREQMRKRLGVDLDLSANDVRTAMSNMLQEATQTDSEVTNADDSLGIIYGRDAAGFEQAQQEGRVYTSTADGRQKFVLSDADATMKPEAPQLLADSEIDTVPLSALMDHDVLFTNMPEARNIQVRIGDNMTSKNMGRYWPGQNLIEVSASVANGKAPATLRETLMHEAQHWVQEQDGGIDAFRAVRKSPEEQKTIRNFNQAKQAYDDAGAALMQVAGRIVDRMPGKTNKAVARSIINSNRTPIRKALDLSRLVDDTETRIEDIEAREAYNQFADSLNTYRDMLPAYNQLQQELHARYAALPTEAEAFFTQRNVDTPQSELPTNPEMEDWEFGTTQGADVGRMALMRGMRQESLGMSGTARPSKDNLDFMDNLWETPLYRGDSATPTGRASTDGALGPGYYYTSDRQAAASYGPNVSSVYTRAKAPLVITMEEVNSFDGNTARAIAQDEAFWKENFNTKGAANRWAESQWDDWAGIGDSEFQQMARDAGYDSVVLMDGDTVVEMNIFDNARSQRNESLGMAGNARNADTAFRNRNKATTFITSALRNDRGLGAHIRDEVELAKAAPVEFEAQANRAAGQYDSGIAKIAASSGRAPAEVNAEIRDRLEEIANLDGSASEYKAAFDNIVNDYGQAGAALNRLRNLVDDLSTDFIQTYLDSGKKLTEKEKDDIRKVAANLGRYTHRFYASRQGHGLGNKYSQAVQKAVDKAQADGETALTAKEQELYGRYVNASKRILEGVAIPEDLSSLTGDNVDYLYDTWIGTDPTMVDRQGKEDALSQIREEIGPEDMEQKADAAAQSLLWGVQNTAASRMYDRGEKLNTTIMQKRKSIPKEIRDLLGEVTDPAGALVATVSKQAEYVARTKLMLSLRNMADPADLQPPGSSGNAAVRNNNMKELTGEAYGPLQGYWASPSMQAMIGDTTEQLQNFTDAMITGHQNYDGTWTAAARVAANVWMRAAGGAKAVNIVGNLFRYPLNLVGSFAMLGVNGNLNVKSYGRGLSDAVDIIRYAAKPGQGLGGAVTASKYRVVDSATVGDLKNLDVGKIEQIVREMSGKSPGTFMRKARELGMAGKELYAMMDVWSKLANFHGEVDFLNSLYKSEGITKSEDEVYREASAIVNNTNMSYSRTLPFLKALERGGITQYGPYLYEAHRVVLANLYQGMIEVRRAKEFTDSGAQAKMAARGLARMTGTAGVLAMLAGLSHFAAGMWGDDEEDRRALLPEYARVMDFMPVGKDSEGRPILYGVSNADPLGPITDLYRAARISDKPTEALWKQFQENYIAPSLGGALWDAAARTTGVVDPKSPRPKKPLVAQWFPNGWSTVTGATGGEDAWSSVANLIETRYMPGTPRAWSDSNPIAAGGSADAITYNIMRGIGARSLRYDPEVGTRDAAFGYDDTIKNLRRDLAAYVENTTNPSAEEITSRLLDMRKEERKVYEQLAKTRRGMLSLGMTPAEADAQLKEARVPKELIEQLGKEEFVSRVISETSIQSAAKTQIRKAKTEADKDKLADKWETAWEILSELQGGK